MNGKDILKYIFDYIFFCETLMMSFVYKFPTNKDMQAKSECNIAMVPLKMVSRLFPSVEEYIAQRRINKSRIR